MYYFKTYFVTCAYSCTIYNLRGQSLIKGCINWYRVYTLELEKSISTDEKSILNLVVEYSNMCKI